MADMYGKGKGFTAFERWASKVLITDTCWLWQGALEGGGYGVFWLNGRNIRAHRFSYEKYIAKIPQGLVLDHLCKIRNCVNPEHLEPVTTIENIQRGRGCYNKLKTHCKQGHNFTPENTYIKKNGGRDCRECNRLRGYKRNKNDG